ncbi:hypothetical protein [Leifsonia sp. NPDC058248]|uniref:hypothetical protein n=1 Tax=Leifsonia sp. NPDC058248 TaxID=3346402 RepID=UPI0036DC3FF1
MRDGTSDERARDDDAAAYSAQEGELREQLAAARAELVEAKELAESYRLAAKARAEQITELLVRAEASPALAQTRELRRLRELEKRWAVRVVVTSLEPLERPYQALKGRLRGGGAKRG